MKKLILIFNAFITVITLSSCESPHQQESTTSFESSYVKSVETSIDTKEATNMNDYILKMEHVQEQLSKVTNDVCFQDADLNEKVQLIEPILIELTEQEYITDYEIDLQQRMPCITLFYDVGGTCVVFLDDFPDYEN